MGYGVMENEICVQAFELLYEQGQLLYKSFAELAEQECSFKRSTAAGRHWSVNWNWEDYEEQWHIAKTWWKAQIIIMNLRFLKGMTGALYGGK